MTLLEKSIFKLFESGQGNFLIFLLRNIPNINTYLHTVNPYNGQLPLFRVLNIFQSNKYE